MSKARDAREGGPLPYVAFAICTLVWGSTFLFIRMGNDSLPPVWAATVRLTLAALLLSAIAFAARQPWPRGASLRAAIAFGVVDFGVSLPLLYWGEKAVPSGIAAILYASMPLMTAGFVRLAGLETIRPLKIVAALVGLAGVCVLVSSEVHGHMPPLLTRLLKDANIPLVKTVVRDPKYFVTPTDLHPNALAHQVYAEKIHEYLSEFV